MSIHLHSDLKHIKEWDDAHQFCDSAANDAGFSPTNCLFYTQFIEYTKMFFS